MKYAPRRIKMANIMAITPTNSKRSPARTLCLSASEPRNAVASSEDSRLKLAVYLERRLIHMSSQLIWYLNPFGFGTQRPHHDNPGPIRAMRLGNSGHAFTSSLAACGMSKTLLNRRHVTRKRQRLLTHSRV